MHEGARREQGYEGREEAFVTFVPLVVRFVRPNDSFVPFVIFVVWFLCYDPFLMNGTPSVIHFGAGAPFR